MFIPKKGAIEILISIRIHNVSGISSHLRSCESDDILSFIDGQILQKGAMDHE